jgi:cytochrome b561
VESYEVVRVVDVLYLGAAIALHWATAVLILANLLLGLSMVPLPISPRKLQWYLWHKSIGVTIFLLTSLRLAWRALRPHPAPVPMPRWQRRAAAAAHALLYVLLIAIPVSGWLYSSATGVQVVYAGVLALPDLVPKDKALADVLRAVHVALNSLLAAVVCVHVAAALKHHFVDRDEVLVRMLPGSRVDRVARS